MTTLTRLKLALLLVALAIWGFGVRTGSVVLPWVGIGFVVAAFAVRFFGPRGTPPE